MRVIVDRRKYVIRESTNWVLKGRSLGCAPDFLLERNRGEDGKP